MTIKVGGKEYCLDGYANINELQKLLIEVYQQGRADAIDDVSKLKKCNHYDMLNELMYQSIKVSDIERLKSYIIAREAADDDDLK